MQRAAQGSQGEGSKGRAQRCTKGARTQGCEEPSGNVELQKQGRDATMQKGAWECEGVEEQRRNAPGQIAMRKGRAAVKKCEAAMGQEAVQECRDTSSNAKTGAKPNTTLQGCTKQCKNGGGARI